MNERHRGWFGLIQRCPVLCLAITDGMLSLSAMFDLLLLRFESVGPLFRTGLFGWPSVGAIPLPFLFVAGIVGLPIGTVLLIFAAAYRHGRPSGTRLFGYVLVGIGMMVTAVGLYLEPHGAQPGIVFVAVGAILLMWTPHSTAD